ncbi:hypothetical protein F442_03906, partial [Phytophthora nicotianae P10297]
MATERPSTDEMATERPSAAGSPSTAHTPRETSRETPRTAETPTETPSAGEKPMTAPGAHAANSLEDLSTNNYVAGLTELVMNANLGEVNYNRQLLCRNIERSIDRYRSGGFNLENAVPSGAPILVFTGAYNDLVSGCDGDRLSETLSHLYNEFGTQNVPAFVDKQVGLSRSR